MTTHPAMVVACAEVFRNAGAFVTVGEAPGHMRDTEAALVEGRLGDALLDAKLPFADLNYEESQFLRNAGGKSKLPGFYFPRSILEADLVVSMPKLEDAPLGRSDRIDEEPLRHAAGQSVRLAEKRAPPRGHSADRG